jgi:hypothetical protein
MKSREWLAANQDGSFKAKFGNSNGVTNGQGGGPASGAGVNGNESAALDEAGKPVKTELVDLDGIIQGYRRKGWQRMANSSSPEEAEQALKDTRKESLADMYYRQLVGANKRSADAWNPVRDVPVNERHGVLRGYVPMGPSTQMPETPSQSMEQRVEKQKHVLAEQMKSKEWAQRERARAIMGAQARRAVRR